MRLQATDINLLLAVGIIGLIFTAYELAGLLLPGWHTISFYAHEHVWLRWLVSGAFVVAGLSLALWFPIHAAHDIPR